MAGLISRGGKEVAFLSDGSSAFVLLVSIANLFRYVLRFMPVPLVFSGFMDMKTACMDD